MILADKDKNKWLALTALWAFAESGLGGIMHAFKLPFTGLFVGGFAVIIVGCMSFLFRPAFHKILISTLIVIMVKAIVSPHSPPTAYIAVGFQGVLGALLLGFKFKSTLLYIIFGILAMLESAFQKLLVLTLIYGTEFWAAFDAFQQSILKQFVFLDFKLSSFIILTYLIIYGIWGIFLGFWINALPNQILKRQFIKIPIRSNELTIQNKMKYKKYLQIGFFILFILIFYLVPSAKGGNPYFKSVLYILRTIGVFYIWIYAITPFLQNIILRLFNKSKYQKEVNYIINLMPEYSNEAKSLWHYVKLNFKGLNRYKEFVLIMLARQTQD